MYKKNIGCECLLWMPVMCVGGKIQVLHHKAADEVPFEIKTKLHIQKCSAAAIALVIISKRTFWRCPFCHIWRKTNTAFHKKYITTAVKHGSGIEMVRGCFAASGPGWLAIIDGTGNSALNHEKPQGECLAISLWPQAQERLGYAAGKLFKIHQQVHILKGLKKIK